MTTDPHRLISRSCPYCKGWDLNVVELVILPAGDELRSYISDFFVGCGFCGALGPPASSEIEAVERWNQRSE